MRKFLMAPGHKNGSPKSNKYTAHVATLRSYILPWRSKYKISRSCLCNILKSMAMRYRTVYTTL